MLVCLLALLCTRDTPGSSRARRRPTVSGTLFSTVLLQQVAWEGGLRQVRGCDHAALPWAALPICRCPGRSHGQTGMLTISSGVGPPFWHRSPSDCPSSGRFTIRNQDVLTGLHPETDECTRFHPVFCFRSICQRTHLIPHSFSKQASAHVVSATSPPFEWYFPIRPNCVQVQQGGRVHNHPSNGLRFWWYLHLAVEHPPVPLLSRPRPFPA